MTLATEDVKFENWFSMLLETTMSGDDERQTVAIILGGMLIYAKEKNVSVLLNQRTTVFKKYSENLRRSACELLKECPELQMALNQYLEADNQIEIPTELTNEWQALTQKMEPGSIVSQPSWSTGSSPLATSDHEQQRRAMKRLKIGAEKYSARYNTKPVNGVKRRIMFPIIPSTGISGADLKRKFRNEVGSSRVLSQEEIQSSKPTEPAFKKYKFCNVLACFITIKAEIRCIRKGYKGFISKRRAQVYKPLLVYHDRTPPRSPCASPPYVTFNHIELIGYIQKINNYYEKQPYIYQKFINILNRYGQQYYAREGRRAQLPFTKVYVCQQIAELIQDVDLLQEFIQFLPYLGYLCRNAIRLELLNR